MREIKFRAWDKKFNIMLDPEAFNRNDVWISGDGKVYEIEEWSDYGGGGKREIDCTEQYILMQYTGLKDRNGKEIYEGDVLQHKTAAWIGKVIFEEGSYKVETSFSKWTLNSLRVEKTEVISNIYENQSLLEEKE